MNDERNKDSLGDQLCRMSGRTCGRCLTSLEPSADERSTLSWATCTLCLSGSASSGAGNGEDDFRIYTW